MSIYETLSKIDVTPMVKELGPHKLSYIPWAKAWDAVKKVYPDMAYRIFTLDDSPLFPIANGGMVHVSLDIAEGTITQDLQDPITDDSCTEEVWLPVMDNRNNAIPLDDITARDVNDTLQRALVKVLALHGFGINVYKGEEFRVDGDFKHIESDEIPLNCDKCGMPMVIKKRPSDNNLPYWYCKCGHYIKKK